MVAYIERLNVGGSYIARLNVGGSYIESHNGSIRLFEFDNISMDFI